MRNDAEKIIRESIAAVLPDRAVERALGEIMDDEKWKSRQGRVYLVAIGKAAWQMADKAVGILGDRLTQGIVITKYDHVKGVIDRTICYEAGHPVPDHNSFRATEEVLKMTTDLTEDDKVLLLISGGGSALFEKSYVTEDELEDITRQLLACGADIREMNTIRKRLSEVKGGRFAEHCAPAGVYSIVLSDIIGDPLDMIASGPAYPDQSTSQMAMDIVEKYQLNMSAEARQCMLKELPRRLDHVETRISGSVRELCLAAKEACEKAGYDSVILTDCLECEAREAGAFLGAIAVSHQNTEKSLAFIAGGETVVHVTGTGKGGRNQEIVLAAAEKIRGTDGTAVFSIGSDGTDGPTDAAGGYCDGETRDKLAEKGISIYEKLQSNDAYHALECVDGLIKTGATGTNVNDVSVVLIKRDERLHFQ